MLSPHYESGFKQELIATAVVLAITAVGTFLILGIYMTPDPKNQTVLGTQSVAPNTQEVDTQTQPPIASPQPSPSPSSIPSPSPQTQEFSYGASQNFENDYYVLQFTEPKLLVSNSTLFRVSVTLGNKSLSQGIENTLTGTISREGTLITENAPLSISDPQTVMPGEQITFNASLSLPDKMQLDSISFSIPDASESAVYLLDPTLQDE